MKIRFGIQVFWLTSFFGSLLLALVFPQSILKILFWLLTFGALVPFVATHYLSLIGDANEQDFSYLAAMFLIYAFIAVFYVDDPQRFFVTCVVIFIATGLESYRPNWLFEIKSRLLKKKE